MLFFPLAFLLSCSSNSILVKELNLDDSSNGFSKITGKVIDKKTLEPLIGAKITFKNISDNISYDVQTDVYGLYSISNIKSGNYNIFVQYVGYITEKHLHIYIKENYNYEINAELEVDTKNVL